MGISRLTSRREMDNSRPELFPGTVPETVPRNRSRKSSGIVAEQFWNWTPKKQRISLVQTAGSVPNGFSGTVPGRNCYGTIPELFRELFRGLFTVPGTVPGTMDCLFRELFRELFRGTEQFLSGSSHKTLSHFVRPRGEMGITCLPRGEMGNSRPTPG